MVKIVNDRHSHNSGKVSLQQLMPADANSIKVLQERARLLAAINVQQDDKLRTNYIRFQCGNHEFYGIAYEEILDIKQNEFITKIPMTPAFVLGISYWHGKLISVIDISKYFALGEVLAIKRKHYIATIAYEKMMIGISFDDVVGVDAFSADNLDRSINANAHIRDSYVHGIHRGTTTILNIKNILADIVRDLMSDKGKKS